MSRRVSLRRFTPAALAAFIAAIAAPRPGVLVHHHVGGEHVHLHVDDDDGTQDHDQSEPHQHHDPLHPGETAVEAPDGSATWHAHIRQPFQSAAPITLPQIAPVETVLVLAARSPSVAPSCPSLPTRARAPPFVAGS